MDLDPADTDQVWGTCTYAQWATINDLGFLLRHYIKPQNDRSLPAWDRGRGCWRHPDDMASVKNLTRIVSASIDMQIEFVVWDSAGRPDGFETANITEYWSMLDPHVRAKDDRWKRLVEETAQLRAEGADIFGAAYKEQLKTFVGEYLAPVAVKPAKT